MSSRRTPVKLNPYELQDLIPRPQLFADEDPAGYEGLRQALLSDLSPSTPYERALAENLVTLEWEAARHRRMRDEIIRAKARDLAAGAYAKGVVEEVRPWMEEEDEAGTARARDLVSGVPARVRRAGTALNRHEITVSEVFAKAYAAVAQTIEPHERKLAEFEPRRRRLREEFDRLKSVRGRPVEDAEIIE